jgi:hypothetical protein
VHRLEQSEVATHPFVIGELALGSIRDRRSVLDLLAALSTTIVAHDEEALRLSSAGGRGTRRRALPPDTELFPPEFMLGFLKIVM